jgi:hypothetical protein
MLPASTGRRHVALVSQLSLAGREAGGSAQGCGRGQGHRSKRLFRADAPAPGGAWTDQLAEALARADAFILLIGEHGIGKWQVPEYDAALDRCVESGRTFPLIVVLLEGQTAPGLPFLRQVHWIVTANPASETDVARIFKAASGIGSGPLELWRYASPMTGPRASPPRCASLSVLSATAPSGRLFL